MDAKNIEKLVQKAKDDILQEVHDRLPRKVGVIAVNHFKQNFRDGGWLDAGLHPWKKTKRQQQNGTDAKYGPITSRRNHLMSSIQSKISKSSCKISRSLMKTYGQHENIDQEDTDMYPLTFLTVLIDLQEASWQWNYGGY